MNYVRLGKEQRERYCFKVSEMPAQAQFNVRDKRQRTQGRHDDHASNAGSCMMEVGFKQANTKPANQLTTREDMLSLMRRTYNTDTQMRCFSGTDLPRMKMPRIKRSCEVTNLFPMQVYERWIHGCQRGRFTPHRSYLSLKIPRTCGSQQ